MSFNGEEALRVSYNNRKVLITGGLGFIGSNLAIRLAREGARVTIVDDSVIGCGANEFNIEPVRDSVQVIPRSIAEADYFHQALEGCEVVFNLAGEISHIHSMAMPERDLEINTLAQLHFLSVLTRHAPGVRVVYAGTRQVYGAPEYLPVDEKHPINPVDFNGVHKYAATMYHLMLSNSGQLDAVVLRLTNVYGPRMALDVPCQGFLGTFLRKLATGQRLEIFGDGRQLRDPVYVDDVVEAFIIAGAAEKLGSRSYNVGGPEPLSMAEIAAIASEAAGVEPPAVREFPEDRKMIDIGSYYTDSTLIRGELGWSPSVRFPEGLARTLDYCRQHLPRYLDPAILNPPCKLDLKPTLASPGKRTPVPA
jgi:UDP-glucose 4-epimerase